MPLPKKFTKQESIDGALGAVYKITEMAGIETKSLHDSVRKKAQERKESKTVNNDVEAGRLRVREEAKQILKEHVENRVSADGEDSETKPSVLNNQQLQEMFKILEEAEEKENPKVEEGNVDKIKKGMTIGGATVTLLIFGPIAFAIFYVGYKHEDDCPIESMPNWLRVSGLIWIGSTITTIVDFIAKYKESKSLQKFTERINSVIRFMSFLWSLYGIYLIWPIWDGYTIDDPNADTYCHPTVMLFSKIMIVLFMAGWIIAAVLFTCLCVCLFIG